MTNRDTSDIIMGQIIDLKELADNNSKIVMNSLEYILDILKDYEIRIRELEKGK